MKLSYVRSFLDIIFSYCSQMMLYKRSFININNDCWISDTWDHIFFIKLMMAKNWKCWFSANNNKTWTWKNQLSKVQKLERNKTKSSAFQSCTLEPRFIFACKLAEQSPARGRRNKQALACGSPRQRTRTPTKPASERNANGGDTAPWLTLNS